MVAAKIIDHYGNNFAVQCEACSGVFIISEMLNRKNGRPCPHCNKALVSFDGSKLPQCETVATTLDTQSRIRNILDRIKPLAVEFYHLTKNH